MAKKRHIEVSSMTQADRGREKTSEKSTSKTLFGMEIKRVMRTKRRDRDGKEVIDECRVKGFSEARQTPVSMATHWQL